ncbi:MAG: citrate lyase subunit alpha, partial [Thermoplasmata archaeon]|nr:citrate lyase subunit alpha [Thermoplasmata archaeon]
MELVKNSLGRDVPSTFYGRPLRAFSGHDQMRKGSKLLPSIEEAIERAGLKDGMTVSFHHLLRQGDNVINPVMEAIAGLGIKNIRMASTALFPVHEPVIEHIKSGVVDRIEGSMNGPVGAFVSYNPEALVEPAILRSHGRRGAAIQCGELPVDVAFVAASQADDYGSCNGIWGKSAFGPMAYSYIDTIYAKKVVVITDDLQTHPTMCQEITEDKVDHVVQVDSIGDPTKIVTGSLSITTVPSRLKIAQYAVDLMDAIGLIKDGLVFQSGAGGMSLAATKFLGDRILEKGVVANSCLGGTTKFVFDIYDAGGVDMVYIGQAFDSASIDFCREHQMGDGWLPMNAIHYASPLGKSRGVDHLDAIFLGGTEVDVDFNVNVNTHSDGQLLHG